MTENLLDTSIDFTIGGGLGLIVWFFGGLDKLFEVLIALVIIDYITGMIAAGINHEISSEIGFKGIAKKCYMIMFVGIAHLLDDLLVKYLPDNLAGSVRVMVTTFYILNETTSIIENADELGVPIPKPLHNLLLKLHKMQDEKFNAESDSQVKHEEIEIKKN
ncbi:MAG: phage holin family protein [Synergistaceae bacterium]|nr:phage holin family protein [Synergistaceae bacterium]